jgi:uncharacterized cupredoxin-like copper-binding protein
MPRKGNILSICALVIPMAALAIAGCGGSSSKASSPSTSTPSTSTPSTTAPTRGGQTLKLSADPSGKLAFNTMSLSAKAGKVTLVMKNPSSAGVQHGIAVEGNGVDKDGPIVQPGKTSTLTVDLKPGKYQYYCPFDAHKAAGMTGTLTVR